MTVLVTGASRGLGRALAEAWRARGAEVVAAARTAGAGSHVMDVADPVSVRALATELEGRAVEVLICNAGIFPDKGQALETGFAPETWAEVFATNVTGAFLTVQAFLPHLRRAKAPRVAVIASRLGSSEYAQGGRYIYRASKAAAVNLGRNMAADLAPEGIAVGIYHPGWVRTDMGGPEGEIDVATSVAGLMARIDELSVATTGRFLAWDGRVLPY